MKKKLWKRLRTLLIVIASALALVYATVFLGHKVFFKVPDIEFSQVPTIEATQNEEFLLGVQAHKLPATLEEYITDVLAAQVRRHNELAPALWKDSALVDKTLILECVEDNRFWRISPDGSVATLTKEEVSGYGINHVSHPLGFDPFDGGMYVAVSSREFNNVLSYEHEPHSGTYMAFSYFTHELFHSAEQEKWAISSPRNFLRNEYTKNAAGRAWRCLIQRQLMRAVADPDDPRLILEALATHKEYTRRFPKEYQKAIETDRSEGTAFYYELISCLYASYPNQIQNRDALRRALSLLMAREDIYVIHGLVREGYRIGGLACVLLDRLDPSGGWQERIMNDANLTPEDLLLEYFEEQALPAPQEPTQAEIDAVAAAIKADKLGNKTATAMFAMLYDMLF